MNNVPSYLLTSAANLLEDLSRYLRSVVEQRKKIPEGALVQCTKPRCEKQAVYLGRCEIHQHNTNRKICNTCFQPSYHGHNSECLGREFTTATQKEFQLALTQLNIKDEDSE